MKIKQTILVAILLVGFASVLIVPAASAATCGGVQTALLSCDQKGQWQCPKGVNPYEGNNPGKDDAAKTAYAKQYGHDWGKCADGSSPIETEDDNGIWGLLALVISILTGGIGILAVGGIVYGSIMYATAAGSADQVKKAKGIITNIVIGLVAYALMFSLLNFIIPGGLLT